MRILNYSQSRRLSLTSWHYSGFGTKLSPIFGFAKSSQIQNHLSIKPNAQIRCSGCWRFGCCLPIFLIINRFSALSWQIKNPILAQISAKFHSLFSFQFHNQNVCFASIRKPENLSFSFAFSA